jgi:hypothetical protein
MGDDLEDGMNANVEDLVIYVIAVILAVVILHWITNFAPPHVTIVYETPTGTSPCPCTGV